jgi:hypothetical protein
MIILFSQRSGAGDFELLHPAAPGEFVDPRENGARLLESRGFPEAAEILRSPKLELMEATNHFGDDFNVLHEMVDLAEYEKLRKQADTITSRLIFSKIAGTVSEIGPYVRFIAASLGPPSSGPAAIPSPPIRVPLRSVEAALVDAEILVRSSGSAHAVDRIHTALSGYLEHLCDQASIPVSDKSTITALLRQLRSCHPALQSSGARGQDVTRMLRGLAAVVDAAQPIRNEASLAHAATDILAEPEGMLVINAVRTILHYLHAKLETS